MNKEEKKIYMKEYWEKNLEKHISNRKKWRKENPEKRTASDKKYYSNHKEEAKLWVKNNPEKVRETDNKHHFKRRDWTSIPFNVFFEGAVGHHYDKFHIIWIPASLHKKISHCLETGKNMTKINELAFSWLISEGR
jgi:hypothetical protein